MQCVRHPSRRFPRRKPPPLWSRRAGSAASFIGTHQVLRVRYVVRANTPMRFSPLHQELGISPFRGISIESLRSINLYLRGLPTRKFRSIRTPIASIDQFLLDDPWEAELGIQTNTPPALCSASNMTPHDGAARSAAAVMDAGPLPTTPFLSRGRATAGSSARVP